ncbi:hypothetical protein ACHQM5_006944 [Ranunculus cassubicifolius]
MGNCQAIDAASLVIQHPSGRVERLYWPITANEVMKSNPSHYVALIITSTVGDGEKNVGNGVRVTRVKLLKATDMLNLRQAYRLIDSKEVMKGLWAKKYAKMKMKEHESNEKMQNETQKPVCQKQARTTSEAGTSPRKTAKRANPRKGPYTINSLSEAFFDPTISARIATMLVKVETP